MSARSNPLARATRCAALALAALLAACGGGGDGGGGGAGGAPAGPGTSTASVPLAEGENAVALTLDKGVDGSAVNSPYVSVTVCHPGTQACQVIDHVLVDTGSFGLRIQASALGGVTLPAVNAPGGAPLAECASFASGYTWGSVRTADVQIGGKQAAAIPVQVIDDTGPAYANVPTSCSNTGPELGTAGSKGILGVGFFTRDCGSACTTQAGNAVYFSCPPAGCVSSTAPLVSQVANPVPFFAGDNNGLAITLPAIPLGGVGTVTGSMVFGVNTRDNNQQGTLPVYQADNAGNVRTTYKGTTGRAFIDSGSNGIFFSDSTIARCGNGFFCPPAALSLTATISGIDGVSSSVPFKVESARVITNGTAVAHLGGDLGLVDTFDWGLPFFFGRTVFMVFEGAGTSAGTGPYWSF
jgi:hypothetical protein